MDNLWKMPKKKRILRIAAAAVQAISSMKRILRDLLRKSFLVNVLLVRRIRSTCQWIAGTMFSCPFGL